MSELTDRPDPVSDRRRKGTDRRRVERRKPKRGVNMRHDDPPSDEALGSKRHRRNRAD